MVGIAEMIEVFADLGGLVRHDARHARRGLFAGEIGERRPGRLDVAQEQLQAERLEPVALVAVLDVVKPRGVRLADAEAATILVEALPGAFVDELDLGAFLFEEGDARFAGLDLGGEHRVNIVQRLLGQSDRLRQFQAVEFLEVVTQGGVDFGLGSRQLDERDVELKVTEYDASRGREVFLSFETKTTDTIVGYARLRLPSSVKSEAA